MGSTAALVGAAALGGLAAGLGCSALHRDAPDPPLRRAQPPEPEPEPEPEQGRGPALPPPAARAVLQFWFGGDTRQQYTSLWFAPHHSAQQRAADATITERFGATLAAAERGELEGWRSSGAGLVALIVVLDQFTRHVYRGHAERGKMGGGEPNNARALGCAEQLLDRG